MGGWMAVFDAYMNDICTNERMQALFYTIFINFVIVYKPCVHSPSRPDIQVCLRALHNLEQSVQSERPRPRCGSTRSTGYLDPRQWKSWCREQQIKNSWVSVKIPPWFHFLRRHDATRRLSTVRLQHDSSRCGFDLRLKLRLWLTSLYVRQNSGDA